MTAQQFNRWVHGLGAICAACFLFQTITSYGMAPLAAFDRPLPIKAQVFNGLADSLDFLGSSARDFLTGHSLLAQKPIWIAAYCAPILVVIVVCILLLMLLSRYHAILDATTPRTLSLWATVFAALSIPALPVMVNDFWLSVGWGRMIAAGVNPYYVNLSTRFAGDLPMEQTLWSKMTYGPLWALISGAVMFVAGGRAWLGAFLFKLILAGAWLGALYLIRFLLRDQSTWHQCLGILFFAWFPLSVHQMVADGHNDIFVVVFVLLWLCALESHKEKWGTLALALSVLIKYVTAPLFLLDWLYAWRQRRNAAYLSQLTLAAPVTVATFAVFYRSREFFRPVLTMATWYQFSPRQAVTALSQFVGYRLYPLYLVVFCVFPLVALIKLWRYWQQPSKETFQKVVLAVMCAVLFGAAGHVWPWFVLWVLSLAAVVPDATLTRWVSGVALGAPFLLLPWTVYPEYAVSSFLVPSLLLYTAALLWFGLAPKQWYWVPEVVEQTGRTTRSAV